MRVDFRRVRGVDRLLEQVQDNVRRALDQLADYAILFGRLKTVAIGSAPTLVEHGLGRAPRGWIVAGINRPARVWEDAALNPAPGRYLVLVADQGATVNLWIF